MAGKGNQQKSWSQPDKSAPAAASLNPLPSADSPAPVVNNPKVTMVSHETGHSTLSNKLVDSDGTKDDAPF